MNNLKSSGSSIAIILLLLLSSFGSVAQTQDTLSVCPVKSLPDIFKKKDSLLTVNKPLKNSFLIVIPVIASQPATGFMFGAIGQYIFKGKAKEDKYSTANISATYTTKKQLLINLKNNLLLKHNKIYLSGDWRYYVFSQDNYGLGSDIIPRTHSDENDDFFLESLAQPMHYDYFKFHQTLSFDVAENFYIGAGIHLDGYTNIDDDNLDVANGELTYHYNYCQKYDFNDNEYYVNGVSFNMVFDSRDNQVNANHGWFGNINYRANPSLGKNQKASSVLFAEYKYYRPLSKTNVQHVLAFWTYGQFLMGGDVPYLNLPSIGWDQRSRGGKGYTQGLLRGHSIAYFETEYRFPITCNQLISGTVFANFTSASDKDRDIRLFQYVQPAFGVGLRILIDKATRTNLIFNYAWGRHSKAFYLNASETF